MNKNDRVKRSSHEFELQYTIYNEPHKDTIQIDFYDEETLCDVIDDYIDDFITNAFQDVIADAVAEGGASMNANGIYEISEVASNVYSSAYSYLEDRAKEFSLAVLDDYSDEQNAKRMPIDILAKLKAKLEDRETCECWDVDVGWAISEDAIDFQTKGVWQYGTMVYFPQSNRYRICSETSYNLVLPETIGEYVGVDDRNGTKIFEGDKLMIIGLVPEKDIIGDVLFENGSFGVAWVYCGRRHFIPFTSICNVEYEVIDENKVG